MKKRELLALIRKLEKRIDSLESQLANKTIVDCPFPLMPEVLKVYGPCLHEYPSPWFGTIPPSCKKCGQQAYQPFIVTCSSNSELGQALQEFKMKLDK